MVFDSIFKYFTSRREALREESYNNYHETIRKVVFDDNRGITLLDVQRAAIFELRFYEDYYDVTLRTIRDLKKTFSKSPQLVEELQQTERYILSTRTKYSKVIRFFKRYILYPLVYPILYILVFYLIVLLILKINTLSDDFLFKLINLGT